MKRFVLAPILLAVCAATPFASAQAAGPVVRSIDTEIGRVLVAENGMTLYTFRKDEPNQANCNDACAVNWPPFQAPADAKVENGYSVVMRADGVHQWAKDGKPLYFWAQDKKTGDVSGNGVKGLWDAARP